jgi:transcriptional regulator with XRE-family HTH domain
MSTLKERLEWVLDRRGMSAHAWSVGAGLASAHVNMMLSGRAKEPRRATLEKLARYARVRPDWLMFGSGEPEPVDDADEHAEPALPAATQFEGEPGEMPETLGQRKDYARQEVAAKKKLAGDGETVEDWVWPHVRATNNFTLENTPPSVAMLYELAKFIRDHGNPNAKPRK